MRTVTRKFAKELYDFLNEEKKKPSWWQENPLMTSIIAGIILAILIWAYYKGKNTLINKFQSGKR